MPHAENCLGLDCSTLNYKFSNLLYWGLSTREIYALEYKYFHVLTAPEWQNNPNWKILGLMCYLTTEQKEEILNDYATTPRLKGERKCLNLNS